MRSQLGSTKEKSCSTSMIDFYDEVISLLNVGKAVNFYRAFDTASHKVRTEKILIYGVDGQTVRWVESWLNCQAQRVVVCGMKSMWKVTGGEHSSQQYCSVS